MPEAIRHLHCHVREADELARVYLHVHRRMQWYACVQGRVRVSIEGETFDLRHGQGVLVPPDCGRSIERRGQAAYLIALFEDVSCDLLGACRRTLVIDDALRADFSALVAEVRNGHRNDSRLLIEVLMSRLLLGMRRQAVLLNEVGERRSDELASQRFVQRVEDYCLHHLQRPLLRKDIAAAFSMSEVHLARLFKAGSGVSLHRRLNQLRIDQACRLLADSDLSIAQIADEVGFVSAGHFGKVFRSLQASSPSQWRLEQAGG